MDKSYEITKGKRKRSLVFRHYQIYLMLLPCVLFFAIFAYGPMYGLQIAFKNYNTGLGIWGSPWVGVKQFERFLGMGKFWSVFKNTLTLSAYSLIAGFPIPILFALMLNELRVKAVKKAVQTITYAPHFISTVILASIITLFLSPNSGIVNRVIASLGGEPIYFMSRPEMFKHVYVLSGIWQNFGWGSIIYLAALSKVDESLIEAAAIDGAGKLKRVIHIQIPCLVPMIVIQLILSVGGILSSDFTKVLLLQNDFILDASEVLSTYIYRVGLKKLQFSLGSAMGLFNAVINFVFLIVVNSICRRLGETSLW